tara:strand:+ start:2595 stop:3104 length:510 start_codon:yes stop_codon:yes gene_type:complete
MSGYIYLLKIDFLDKKIKPLYKINTEKNFKNNFKYKTRTYMIHKNKCNNVYYIKNEIIEIFKKNFNQRGDISNEYFEGNCNKMIELIKNYNNKTNSSVVSTVIDVINTLNKSSNIAFMEINNPLSLINTQPLHKKPILAHITSINEHFLPPLHKKPILAPITSINEHFL